VLFTSVSLGSILLLAALGLAITYGLMGVINMAHGELIMVGAYTTYVVQNLFKAHRVFRLVSAGGSAGSFLVAALVGMALERPGDPAGCTAGRWRRCLRPGASA
jgi:urea transport system permease protein